MFNIYVPVSKYTHLVFTIRDYADTRVQQPYSTLYWRTIFVIFQINNVLRANSVYSPLSQTWRWETGNPSWSTHPVNRSHIKAVFRIRDVYPGSRSEIRIFFEPGSSNSKREDGYKNLCTNFSQIVFFLLKLFFFGIKMRCRRGTDNIVNPHRKNLLVPVPVFLIFSFFNHCVFNFEELLKFKNWSF